MKAIKDNERRNRVYERRIGVCATRIERLAEKLHARHRFDEEKSQIREQQKRYHLFARLCMLKLGGIRAKPKRRRGAKIFLFVFNQLLFFVK